MELFKLFGTIAVNNSEANKSIDESVSKAKESQGHFEKLGEKFKKIGQGMSNVGQKLLPVTVGIGGIATAAVKTAADFESAMSQVAAISGAAGDELALLEVKAREMGSKTKFSAKEAADAMNYMAMAGWKTSDMLSGIDGIMNLAAASGEDLATTSDIVTDALTAFGLTAADSGKFADLLAQTSANANTNVAMMGETFKYVAPVAGSLGYTAEDVALAIGLMGNAGIKATQAGTALRTSLTNLVSPAKSAEDAMKALGFYTEQSLVVVDEEKVSKQLIKVQEATVSAQKAQIKYNEAVQKHGENSSNALMALEELTIKNQKLTTSYDELQRLQQGSIETSYGYNKLIKNEDGSMKSLKETLDGLRTAFANLSEAEQAQYASDIFGKEAMSGMLAIINASEEDYKKLTEAIENSDGAAQEMADTMNNNLNGQLTILKSALSEAAISIGQALLPNIKKAVEKIQEWTDKFNNLSDAQKQNIMKIAGIVAAIAPLLLVGGKMFTGLSKISKAISVVSKSGKGLSVVMGGISVPILAVVASIAALVAAFKHLWETNDDFKQNIIDTWNRIKEKFAEFTEGIVARINALGFNFEDFSQVVKEIWNKFCEFLAPVFEGAFNQIANIIQVAFDVITGITDIFVGLFSGNWEQCWLGVQEIFDGVWDFICNTFDTCVNAILSIADIICGWFGTSWNEVWQGVCDFFVNTWNTIKSAFQTCADFLKSVWETICNVIQVAVMFIGSILQAAFDIITLPFRFIWENCKEYIIAAWDFLSEKISSALNFISEIITSIMTPIVEFFSETWDAISTAASEMWDFITTYLSEKWDAISSKVSEVWTGITSKISDSWSSAKENTLTKINEISTKISDVFGLVKVNVTNTWNSIKEAISKPITEAKDKVHEMIEKIKEKFNFTWSLPKLKLPHFSIKGEFSLNPPSVPSFGIDWYKKAMNDPMIMNEPTAFGINAAGQIMAGGEAGSEVVSGTNTLMNMISSAVEAQNSTLVDALYKILDAILAMDENMGGNLRDALCDTSLSINNREFARLVKAVN